MNRGQVKLLLIAAVFVTPVALSYATYFFLEARENRQLW